MDRFQTILIIYGCAVTFWLLIEGLSFGLDFVGGISKEERKKKTHPITGLVLVLISASIVAYTWK